MQALCRMGGKSMKKSLLAVLAVFLLAACSQPSSTADTSSGTDKPADTEKPAETAEPLSSDEILDVVLKDAGISASRLSDIKVSLPDKDGNITVTFGLNDQTVTYVVNETTGEIVSSDLPEGAAETVQTTQDPMEEAINAAFNTLEGYQGGAENITVKPQGTVITVDFDWNGEHYTLQYDTAAHQIVE